MRHGLDRDVAIAERMDTAESTAGSDCTGQNGNCVF